MGKQHIVRYNFIPEYHELYYIIYISYPINLFVCVFDLFSCNSLISSPTILFAIWNVFMLVKGPWVWRVLFFFFNTSVILLTSVTYVISINISDKINMRKGKGKRRIEDDRKMGKERRVQAPWHTSVTSTLRWLMQNQELKTSLG